MLEFLKHPHALRPVPEVVLESLVSHEEGANFLLDTVMPVPWCQPTGLWALGTLERARPVLQRFLAGHPSIEHHSVELAAIEGLARTADGMKFAFETIRAWNADQGTALQKVPARHVDVAKLLWALIRDDGATAENRAIAIQQLQGM